MVEFWPDLAQIWNCWSACTGLVRLGLHQFTHRGPVLATQILLAQTLRGLGHFLGTWSILTRFRPRSRDIALPSVGAVRGDSTVRGPVSEKTAPLGRFWSPKLCWHKIWVVWGIFEILVDFDLPGPVGPYIPPQKHPDLGMPGRVWAEKGSNTRFGALWSLAT